ncbi:hypothetical protein [Melittangium boletus]|uniref:hypothetical protein n=1 Tax=Melittangium boletus TaxID=83453 RepID=UPI003DA5C19E
MKTLKMLGSALVLFGFSNANADVVFYNAAPAKYTVAVTLPNGKIDTRDISEHTPGLDSKSFVLAAGVKTVKVAITDDLGETVWKGSANQDDSFLIVPDGKGVKAVYAGTYGSYGSDAPQAALFLNLTGEPLTLDLEGHNGVGAVRGVTPAATFDPKKPVRLNPKEVTYNVLGKSKGGETVEVDGTVAPGRYCVLWKNTQGRVKVTTLGSIPKKK